MYSIGFPKIFNGSKIKLSKDYDAIKANLKALLASDRGALFGDPYYGTKLKTLLWQQPADPVIRQLIIDDIFEAIYSYMPQISVNRDDITVTVDGNVVSVQISVKADSSIESDLYTITLLTEQESNTF